METLYFAAYILIVIQLWKFWDDELARSFKSYILKSLKAPSASFLQKLKRNTLIILGNPRAEVVAQEAIVLRSLRVWERTDYLLLLCFSTLILPLVFFVFAGLVSLQLSVVTLIFLILEFGSFALRSLGFRLFRSGFFVFGLVVVGIVHPEAHLRFALFNWLSQTEWIFDLMDGRLPMTFTLFALGILASFFLRVRSWSVVLSLVLMNGSLIALTTVCALLLSEFVGLVLRIWWNNRKLAGDIRKDLKWFTILNLVAAIFGLAAVLSVRPYLGQFSFDALNQSQNWIQLLTLIALGFFPAVLCSFAWGHFASGREAENIASQLPNIRNRFGYLVGPGLRVYVHGVLIQRRSSLDSQVTAMDEIAKRGIPSGVVQMARGELDLLNKALGQLNLD